jgi:hypothetical protein
MVINHFYVQGILAVPAETHSPLIIDPDAMLPGPNLRQSFQPIPRRRPKVLKRNRCIKQFQLLSCPLLNPGVNSLCKRAAEKWLR